MKLELYKPYKTRAGHKAVVVDTNGDGFTVYHSEDMEVYVHEADGMYSFQTDINDEKDLISPWQEPRTGEFWVNVYEDGFQNFRKTKEEANADARNDRIALKRVTWTSGDLE